MSDYIKREDALNALREYPVTKLKTAIRQLPSADVTPVKHGRWVYKDEPIFGNPYGRYYCDLCEYGMADKENYCPNCGAKMDGDGNG